MRTHTRPRLVLAGCFLLSVGVNAYIIAPSSVGPLFIARYDITKVAVGNIVSAALIGNILIQLPAGYMLDRYDNRWLIAPAVAFYVGVVLALQVVGSYVPFLVLRALGGVAGGLVFTAGANAIGQVFPASRQGVATGIYLASPSVSFALAHSTSPIIGTTFGPLRVFLLPGSIAVVGMAIFLIGTAEPILGDESTDRSEFVRALGNRSVLLVSISAFTSYGLYLFLNAWLPTYGTEVLSLPLSAAAFATVVVPLVGIVARPGGGWLSGVFGGRRRPVLVLGLCGSILLMLAVPFTSTFSVYMLLIAGAAFALQLGTGVYFVIVRELATEGTEGTSLTVLTTVSFSGSFTAPILGGWIISTYSWAIAFAVFGLLGLLGVTVLARVPEPQRFSSV